MGQVKVMKIEADIASIEANIEKTNALVTKHKNQLEKMIARGDEGYTLRMKEDNIVNAQRKLDGFVTRLELAKEKLVAESALVDLIHKESPKVLIDFTYEWKELALKWHLHQVKEYVKLNETLTKNQRVALVTAMKELPEYAKYFDEDGSVDTNMLENRMFYILRNKGIVAQLKEQNLDDKTIKGKLALRSNRYTSKLVQLKTEVARRKWLESPLEKERIAKLEDLFLRIYDVTGKILEGSTLAISPKGNLDGVIVGEKATVKVDTIGAGGYNVQCFHYRTLVKLIN